MGSNQSAVKLTERDIPQDVRADWLKVDSLEVWDDDDPDSREEVALSQGAAGLLRRFSKYEICERCFGHGMMANPAFDGMTSTDMEEWYGDGGCEEQEEFLAEYTRLAREGRPGIYDVRCERECDGGKVRVPDFERARMAGLLDWLEQKILRDMAVWADDLAELRAQEAMELRYGC